MKPGLLYSGILDAFCQPVPTARFPCPLSLGAAGCTIGQDERPANVDAFRHRHSCAFDYKSTLDAPPSDQERQIKNVKLFIG